MSALDELVAVEECNCYYVVREKVISGVINCAKCNNDGLHRRPLAEAEREELDFEIMKSIDRNDGWILPSGIKVRRK